jgi:hypothetical protein
MAEITAARSALDWQFLQARIRNAADVFGNLDCICTHIAAVAWTRNR